MFNFTNSRSPSLTNTELIVLQLIAYEYSSKAIAELLFVSKHTIYTHRSNLLLKLDAKNTAGLVRRAIEYDILVSLEELNQHPRVNKTLAIAS